MVLGQAGDPVALAQAQGGQGAGDAIGLAIELDKGPDLFAGAHGHGVRPGANLAVQGVNQCTVVHLFVLCLRKR